MNETLIIRLKACLIISAVLLLVASSLAQEQQNKASGGSIVFTSDRHDKPGSGVQNNEIYIINGNGQGERRLTTNLFDDGLPQISASGNRTLFVSWRNGNCDIYELRLSPQNLDEKPQLRRVTDSPAFETDAVYSPDGRTIAFVRETGPDIYALYVIDGEKTEPRRLIPLQGLRKPCFTPDGAFITYTFARREENAPNDNPQNADVIIDLLAIKKDGTGQKLLLKNVGNDPVFSPDGKHILFTKTYRYYTDIRGGASLIYIMDADGTNQRRLSRHGAFDGSPCFSPDGQHIAFDSLTEERSARGMFSFDTLTQRKTHSNIYIMDLNGSNATRLTFGPGDNEAPSWGLTPGVPYIPPVLTPKPIKIEPVKKPPIGDPVMIRSDTDLSGELLYAFNDLNSAPYYSYLFHQDAAGLQPFRLRGLEGTDGDFVFDPQPIGSSENVLVKLGDPVERPSILYNSYRLWMWNRTSNEFRRVCERDLFFRSIAVSPDGRYLAYLAGGNTNGALAFEDPQKLYLCDWRTGKETLVAQDNPGLRAGFCWRDNQTLLYTSLPQATDFTPNTKLPIIRPNIMAFDLPSGQSKLLIRDGAHPLASPDGKRIAFWGLRPDYPDKDTLPLTEDWWQRPRFSSLSATAGDGSNRKAFASYSGFYPSLTWTPDSTRLLIVSQTQASPKSRAQVEQWNVAQGGKREIAKLEASDLEATERSWLRPQFRALSVSRDGKTLFVSGEAAPLTGLTTHTIQAIELENGATKFIARLRNDAGFTWSEDSTPEK